MKLQSLQNSSFRGDAAACKLSHRHMIMTTGLLIDSEFEGKPLSGK